MKFVFYDKMEYEADIIADILDSEGIKFQTKQYFVEIPMFPDSIEDDEFAVSERFDITVNTSVEHFDFVKRLADEKIEHINKLNRCYYKQPASKIKIVKKAKEKRNLLQTIGLWLVKRGK